MSTYDRDSSTPSGRSRQFGPSSAAGGGVVGSSRHVHDMPFGSRRVDDDDPEAGHVFRLWAPTIKHVEVCLMPPHGPKRYFPCPRAPGGWHECTVEEARTGDLYLFRLDGALEVPDPASRFNPQDVHGPSLLVDSAAFAWDDGWLGRPWPEAVIYEMHVGTFTPQGRYDAAAEKLAGLARLGITAIELMPVADFPGQRGWGYDGVLPFAPDAAYGTPDELKAFVQAAHRLGLMVFLDVVYNHFGPDGNYLHTYAPQFFTAAHATPWGGAIAFEAPASATVREFFIENALYWLDEYRFDGLRLDAVHSIFDASATHILEELSARVRALPGRRHIHLVLENVDNTASRLGPPAVSGRYEAQWNDDFHHAAHVLLTGERDGYYADYADDPVRHLMRCLAEGFAFQGDFSPFHGAPRGEPSAALPATAFVNFLQNHDQVGNRAFGERLATLTEAHKLRALVALQLLAPSPPLIFMGEEAGATTPFQYFCDFGGELGAAVRDGRCREFASFERFSDAKAGSGDSREIPDPCDEATFLASKLDWAARAGDAEQEWLRLYGKLLALRHAVVVPLMPRLLPGRCASVRHGDAAFEIRWQCADGAALALRANLGSGAAADRATEINFEPLAIAPFASVGPASDDVGQLAPWSVRAYVVPADGGIE